VYLIHRRDAFRGKKVYADKVRAQSNIELMLDTVPTEIQGEEGVNGLGIKNVKTGEESSLSVDGVFIFVGIKPQLGFVPETVERDETGFIVTDTEMRTNVPGVFAAGDNRSKRCRQITTAVGDGAAAGHSAHIYLEEMPHG
jgi:thioredoxin reductase (NADPH)